MSTLLQVEALRICGTMSMQQGVLVLLDSGASPVERALFWPTERTKNLALETALTAAGVTGLERSKAHDLAALAVLSPAQLEQALAGLEAEGGVVFRALDTELVGGGVHAGKRQFLLRRGDEQVTVNCDPRQPVFDALTHWPRGEAHFEPGKLALVFAGVSAIPMVLTVVSLVLVATRDEPSDWLGVLVWGSMVALAWGGYAYVCFKAKRSAAQA